MNKKGYKVNEDETFNVFCDAKNLTKNSRKKYANCLKNYTNFHGLTLDELLEEADEEEEKISRLTKRTIRKRLINFRTHLIHDKEYQASTITTNMICAKAFYRFNGIEVPEIPNITLPSSPNDFVEFEDLPTRNVIKTAVEATKLSKHKALFLFSFTTGSARMELTNFTFQQFLDGLEPYTTNARTPKDVIEQLDGKCEEKEVIPIFRMRRQKTDYYYNTITTPECVQFMINYLKTEAMNLKPEDRFFQLSEWGVSTAFKLINNKFRWGKRGTRDYFSSHRIRALHASLIEDKNLANYLEGRKPDPITQAYFKRDKDRLREKYKTHMHKFTIYANYMVMINSEAYEQLKEENKEKDRLIAELRDEKDKEIQELKDEIENNRFDKEEFMKEMNERFERLNDELKHLDDKSPYDVPVKQGLDLFIENIDVVDNPTKIEKQIMDLNPLERLTLRELSYELAIQEEDFVPDKKSMLRIIKKAVLKMKRNPDFNIKVKHYYKEKEEIIKKFERITHQLNEKVDELDMWEEDEKTVLIENITSNLFERLDKIQMDEIDDELIMNLIEENM